MCCTASFLRYLYKENHRLEFTMSQYGCYDMDEGVSSKIVYFMYGSSITAILEYKHKLQLHGIIHRNQ